MDYSPSVRLASVEQPDGRSLCGCPGRSHHKVRALKRLADKMTTDFPTAVGLRSERTFGCRHPGKVYSCLTHRNSDTPFSDITQSRPMIPSFPKFSAFAVTVLLASCGSLSYTVPPDRPTASLTLQNSVGPGVIVLNAFQKEDCKDAGKYVPQTTLKPGEVVNVPIEAGRPFSFRVQSRRPATAATANTVVTTTSVPSTLPGAPTTLSTIALNLCDAAGTFFPKAGAQYVVSFKDANGVCEVSVAERDATKPLESFVAKRWFTSSFSEGWHCSP